MIGVASLILQRFRGREDVVAVRTTGSPFPERDRAPLTPDELQKRHLSNGQRLGFYFVRTDNTVRCSCVDVDNHDNKNPEWRGQVERLCCLLLNIGVPFLVEISSSGEGAHVWIFFRDPVPAKLARSFWKSAFRTIGFDSSTEIFPKQDELGQEKEDGKPPLGNLCWFPLNGKSRFVDPEHDWTEIPPIEALSGVRTISELDLKSAVGDLVGPVNSDGASSYGGDFAPHEITTNELREMVDRIPSSHAVDHDEWIAVGMAIHDSFPNEDGLGAFIDFSRKCSEKFDERECRKRWGSFTAGGNRTIATVVRLAKEGGWERPRKSVTAKSGFSTGAIVNAADDDGGHLSLVDPWPDPPAAEAFHGLAGELVDLIDPHTEADRVAILIQILAAFGNLIGKNAHFRVEGDYHSAKLNFALAGTTSKGRKGTSWGQVRRIFEKVDEQWAADRVFSGLSSGEGLIWSVRDPIIKREALKEKGRVVDYQDVEVDPGVADKRAFILESEFASVLKVIQREKSTLSAIIRDAWDRDLLRSMTKNSPAKSTGCHITIGGHITRDELRRTVAETEMANGFANRFLWLCVKRSKCLPESTVLDEAKLEPLIRRLSVAADFGMGAGELRRDQDARELWAKVYPKLSEGAPGLLGSVTSRAEAQVMRLALVYALLDHLATIRACHLMAALAIWDYCEASARYIFGSRLGDPVADEIRDVLKSRPDGMTRSELRDHFSRNRSAEEITAALLMLSDSGMARMQRDTMTGGRPKETWFAN